MQGPAVAVMGDHHIEPTVKKKKKGYTGKQVGKLVESYGRPNPLTIERSRELGRQLRRVATPSRLSTHSAKATGVTVGGTLDISGIMRRIIQMRLEIPPSPSPRFTTESPTKCYRLSASLSQCE